MAASRCPPSPNASAKSAFDRRHLWGCQGLFGALDAELAARFAGPDAGCWRDAVGSALSPTHRHAPRDVYALEDEPDVKRGPGGLRDLQRALWANACASRRSMPLKPSRLVQAHRFLWQVRCHDGCGTRSGYRNSAVVAS